MDEITKKFLEDRRYFPLQTRKLFSDTYNYGSHISTIFAGDTENYETAVLDIRYHNNYIIVEEYSNMEDAKLGHEKWLKIMIENPPEFILNKSTSKYDNIGYDVLFKLSN